MDKTQRKSRIPFWLIIIIVGVVMIIIGAVISSVTGLDKYFPKEDINLSFQSASINRLDIETGICRFKIQKSDDNNITVEGINLPEDRYKVREINNTLEISYNQKWFDFADNSVFHKKSDAEITIYLPEKEYDSFEFDGGIGENKITDLTVRNAEIDTGVGESVFKNFKVKNKTDLDLGVGDVRFENCELNRSDIDAGVGELFFSGKISGYTDIDMGVGEAEFNIDGFKNDYDINYDKGIGEVIINGGETSHVPSKPIQIDLDCGVGEVKFNFK